MQYMFYAEVIADYYCDTECGLKFKSTAKSREIADWDDIKQTLYKWSRYINFEYIGISGGEPMNNLKIRNWIYGIRKILPESKMIFITNGVRLLTDRTLIRDMIEVAPSRLCIVLPQNWKSFTEEFWNSLRQTNYRFIRKGNDPVKGIDYILLSRNTQFDAELYHHVATNPKHTAVDLDFLSKIGAPDLFKCCYNRKYMPVLASGRIFKCRNTYRLWNYWNRNKYREEKNIYSRDIVKKYESIIEDSVIVDISQINLLGGLNKETGICDCCLGCVECLVYPKNK